MSEKCACHIKLRETGEVIEIKDSKARGDMASVLEEMEAVKAQFEELKNAVPEIPRLYFHKLKVTHYGSDYPMYERSFEFGFYALTDAPINKHNIEFALAYLTSATAVTMEPLPTGDTQYRCVYVYGISIINNHLTISWYYENGTMSQISYPMDDDILTITDTVQEVNYPAINN